MTRRHKKFNPNKRTASWLGGNKLEWTLARASQQRLSGDEIDRIELQLLMPLQILKGRFCPAAFNTASHAYRVASSIADELNVGLLRTACREAWTALQQMYNSDDKKPVATPAQYEALAYMIEALLVLLPEVPRPLWCLAVESSKETLRQRMVDQYVSLPAWGRAAAIEVMQGRTVRAIAAEIGQPEREVSEQVRMVGAIMYTLLDDASQPFPEGVVGVRRIGSRLLPLAATHELAIERAGGVVSRIGGVAVGAAAVR